MANRNFAVTPAQGGAYGTFNDSQQQPQHRCTSHVSDGYVSPSIQQQQIQPRDVTRGHSPQRIQERIYSHASNPTRALDTPLEHDLRQAGESQGMTQTTASAETYAETMPAMKTEFEDSFAEERSALEAQYPKLHGEAMDAHQAELEKVHAEAMSAQKTELDKSHAEAMSAQKVQLEKVYTDAMSLLKVQLEKVYTEAMSVQKTQQEKVHAEVMSAQKTLMEKLLAEAISTHRAELEASSTRIIAVLRSRLLQGTAQQQVAEGLGWVVETTDVFPQLSRLIDELRQQQQEVVEAQVAAEIRRLRSETTGSVQELRGSAEQNIRVPRRSFDDLEGTVLDTLEIMSSDAPEGPKRREAELQATHARTGRSTTGVDAAVISGPIRVSDKHFDYLTPGRSTFVDVAGVATRRKRKASSLVVEGSSKLRALDHRRNVPSNRPSPQVAVVLGSANNEKAPALELSDRMASVNRIADVERDPEDVRQAYESSEAILDDTTEVSQLDHNDALLDDSEVDRTVELDTLRFRQLMFPAWDISAEEDSELLNTLNELFIGSRGFDQLQARMEQYCRARTQDSIGMCLRAYLSSKAAGSGGRKMTSRSCVFCQGTRTCYFARHAPGIGARDGGTVAIDGKNVRWIIKKRHSTLAGDPDPTYTIGSLVL
jgi:hypothetical protein